MTSFVGNLIDFLIPIIGSLILIAAYFGWFVKPTTSNEEILDDTPKPNKLQGNKKVLLLGIALLFITILRFLFEG